MKLRIGKKLRPSGSGGSTPAPVADTTPSAFTFTDVAAVAVSTVQTSNSVTPTGYDTPSAISITGGEYELDNTGVWGSTAGLISPGSSVRVRHTASASGGTATNTVLTIGGVSDTFTSTTLSGTITTPVITRTSSAGAAPLTFTASLNTSDTYAGYIFRVQVAANTSSDFTTTTQDIAHTLSESEVTSGDIDITSDGFVTPSGAYSLRVRIERDDGVNSSYSNVLTDTISAATTTFTTGGAAGTSASSPDKAANITVTTGSPRVATGLNGRGTYEFVRATAASANSKNYTEFVVNNLGGGFQLGKVKNNPPDFTTYTGTLLGQADSNGWSLAFWNTGARVELWGNSSTINGNVGTFTTTMVNGDTIGINHDTTANTIQLFHIPQSTGVPYQVGTGTLSVPSNGVRWFFGCTNNEGVTINCGQTTFLRTLDSGYLAHG